MDLTQLQKVIPFQFRLGNGIGPYELVDGKKVYDKYIVLGYIDARDVMDLLDEVVGPTHRQRDHKEIKGQLYGGIGIKIDSERVRKRDTGTESAAEKQKGESSDSFKRAAVNRGIGRFLYTLPFLTVSRKDAQEHSKTLTEYIKEKNKEHLQKRYADLGEQKS